MRKVTRRKALLGSAAVTAILAAGGAAAARVAAEDSPVAAVAKIFWEAHARYMAVLSNPDLTDAEMEEQADLCFDPWIDAHDRMMQIPSASIKDLALKIPVCREVWAGCEVRMNDPKRLGGLLADIDRLAGEERS